ncbi:GAF domain-containing protein [Lentzea sp. NBRC 105346]|uniref:GAF domain-containing protein n=1 Tax=Lentzea sp. NBRC 105346 TaxID=3032205 RepID=UPI0025531860|nr:GAF domain-containing protein [Lentzea sp. NBRC 105346]
MNHTSDELGTGTARIERPGAAGFVVLSGTFDDDAAGALHTALADVVQSAGRGGKVVVDTRDMGLAGAKALSVLLRARQAALAAGCMFSLIDTDQEIHGLMKVSAAQQRVVDAEINSTRLALLADVRDRLRGDPSALVHDEFLGVADRRTVLDAIIVAAVVVGDADACDLQLYHSKTGVLTIERQRGFSPAFLDFFAAVDAGVPSACGAVLATGESVLVDDIAASPLFADLATFEALMLAGTRAVWSYPLRDARDELLGVLSFHYRTTRPRDGRPELVARTAAQALSVVSPDGRG